MHIYKIIEKNPFKFYLKLLADSGSYYLKILLVAEITT